MIEIAVKLVQLRLALCRSIDRVPHIPGPSTMEALTIVRRAPGVIGTHLSERGGSADGDRHGQGSRRSGQTIAERGIEFFFAQFVDMYGRPSAKLIPAAHLDDLVEDGAGFAGFAAGEIGQLPSDPDIAAIPDLDSFTLVPWQPNLARFACDVTVEGEAWPYCPRTILRNVLAQAAEQGYEFKIGIELEYFLVAARTPTARSRSPTSSTRSRSPATTWPA